MYIFKLTCVFVLGCVCNKNCKTGVIQVHVKNVIILWCIVAFWFEYCANDNLAIYCGALLNINYSIFYCEKIVLHDVFIWQLTISFRAAGDTIIHYVQYSFIISSTVQQWPVSITRSNLSQLLTAPRFHSLWESLYTHLFNDWLGHFYEYKTKAVSDGLGWTLLFVMQPFTYKQIKIYFFGINYHFFVHHFKLLWSILTLSSVHYIDCYWKVSSRHTAIIEVIDHIQG